MESLFFYFSPRSTTTLLVAVPGAAPRELQVNASVRKLQKVLSIDFSNVWNAVRDNENDEKLHRPSWVAVGETIIMKMPDFEISDGTLANMLSEIRKHKTLVLDLRGNPGGYEQRLKELVSGTFDHEVKIADLVSRKPEKPIVAKPHSPFVGKIFVLIDSRSASAAELFARTVQLEKRGLVIGDRSSGSVMQARTFSLTSGIGPIWYYGVEVTNADLIMGDGKSLEKVGVTPDEIVLPTQADLAAGRDPMLARAVELAGGEVTPEQAGKVFPVVWTPPRLLN
jgi:C-terminal processing protease CtpA/Prc